MKKKWCGLLCFVLSGKLLAWNALGHKVITQIAYDQLTPSAKHWVNTINKIPVPAKIKKRQKPYRPLSLLNASVWLDWLYASPIPVVKSMHFIDRPFSEDNSRLPDISPVNAVFAIRGATGCLQSSKTPALDKAICLRILLHVVGDVHQPLHAATRVTYHVGDRGGNDFLLGKNKIAKNLHQYWDRGGGLLLQKDKAAVKHLARSIESRWPCKAYAQDPQVWSLESFEIAKAKVYTIQEGQVPDFAYQKTTQDITQQQLAKAGCRLGGVLNQISKKASQY